MKGKITPIKMDEATKERLELAISEVIKICHIFKVPCFISTVVGNDEKNTQYINQVCSATSLNINLKDDKIRRYMLVANDYEVVPSREVNTFDVSDLL